MDFKEKINKEKYLDLKNTYKALSIAGASLRNSAILHNGQIRYKLRYLKRTNGQRARIYHVALCFLRGRKYSQVEPKTLHAISVQDIKDFLINKVNYNYLYEIDRDLELFFSTKLEETKPKEELKPHKSYIIKISNFLSKIVEGCTR